MRPPKRLYAEERIMYHPELLTCLQCGDRLVLWNSLAWDQTVQTLERLLSTAPRPAHCPQATCPGSRLRLLSAAAQRLAPPGSTYGYDALVHIGGLRQYQRATSREIHLTPSARLAISAAHVRYLYQHCYFTPAGVPRASAARPPGPGRLAARGLDHRPRRGLDTGAAALCGVSPVVPYAESFSQTNPKAMRSTASAVVSTPGYRHRVTFAVLPIALA